MRKVNKTPREVWNTPFPPHSCSSLVVAVDEILNFSVYTVQCKYEKTSIDVFW